MREIGHFIGGKEVNDSPTQAHHRYVIDFRDRSEEECRRSWPKLMELLDRKVKPERTRKKCGLGQQNKLFNGRRRLLVVRKRDNRVSRTATLARVNGLVSSFFFLLLTTR